MPNSTETSTVTVEKDESTLVGLKETEQPNSVGGYNPPPGYILVEKTQYDFMLKAMGNLLTPGVRNSGPQRVTRVDEYDQPVPVAEDKGVFKLLMLRQFWLGDINVNLPEGQELEFYPGQYIKISGEIYRKFKSFLAIFRSQYGPKPDPQVLNNPIFMILNEEECPEASSVFGLSVGNKRTFASEEDRILFEENKGDASRRKLSVPGDLNDQLQLRTGPQPQNQPTPRVAQKTAREVPPGKPPGMTDNAWIISHMQADQIERPQGSNVGEQTGHSEPQSVAEFGVSSRMAGGGTTVSKIGGPVADEAKARAANNRR